MLVGVIERRFHIELADQFAQPFGLYIKRCGGGGQGLPGQMGAYIRNSFLKFFAAENGKYSTSDHNNQQKAGDNRKVDLQVKAALENHGLILLTCKHIASAPNRNNAFGIFGVVFDLRPDTRDVHINRSIKGVEILALQLVH